MYEQMALQHAATVDSFIGTSSTSLHWLERYRVAALDIVGHRSKMYDFRRRMRHTLSLRPRQ